MLASSTLMSKPSPVDTFMYVYRLVSEGYGVHFHNSKAEPLKFPALLLASKIVGLWRFAQTPLISVGSPILDMKLFFESPIV
jgi:hypothetical protein